ncbi:hypothetical protein [uncultured Thiodictyon sp.]|uniref:hypothetical protein n=1 Tax=uncultured Thiodictyon sp. TaxID=1846217 RepID=UPI0025F4D54D|nr:hypothetical protein [uncultured Thiodictyon sp.]
MLTIHEEYVTDRAGERKAVLVPIAEWEQILEALEDVEDLRAYDEAKGAPSDPIPFEQAVREIKAGRRE